MNRLQAELHRLYLPRPIAATGTGAQPSVLVDPTGAVRAMVMTLTQPPRWALLSKVWHGVQAELGLPAPAIAVTGTDGLALWFSLAEPASAAQARAFLEGLRPRFLPDVAAERVGLMPAPHASALRRDCHARLVPACHEPSGNWSAFVAPDLVPVFEDTPWLDIPPNEDGQAALLQGMKSIEPAAFEAALQHLAPATAASHADVPVTPTPPVTAANAASAAERDDPRRFLRRVMNDDTVPLALRIEAAKALLQQPSELPPV